MYKNLGVVFALCMAACSGEDATVVVDESWGVGDGPSSLEGDYDGDVTPVGYVEEATAPEGTESGGYLPRNMVLEPLERGEEIEKYWGGYNVASRGTVRLALGVQGNTAGCSGFLINNQTVITAGHCVDQYLSSNLVDDIGRTGFVWATLAMDEPGVGIRSLGGHTFQIWLRSAVVGGDDIAVMRTEGTIQNVNPNHYWLIPQWRERPANGWTLWSFGFGAIEPNGTLLVNDVWMAVNTVSSVSDSSFNVKGGEGRMCKGDSGGPTGNGTGSSWDLAWGVGSGFSPGEPNGMCARDANANQIKTNLGSSAGWVNNVLMDDSENRHSCEKWTTPLNQKVQWCWAAK